MVSEFQLNARDIYIKPIEEINQLPFGIYKVLYEDGITVEEHRQAVIFNRYCWELFSLYPNTPIHSTCSVINCINGGYFNANTHIKTLETIFNHICAWNGLRFYKDKEPLLRASYVIVNRIFNEIVHGGSESVTTIDAVDFVEVIEDPDIVELHKKLTYNPESVEATYRGIRSYMNNPAKSNRFVKAYRSKSINDNQGNQCIGPRGFVTGLDRTVYRQPVVNGFIRGMGSLYEIMVESLTAAKSLNANDTHIRTSEYASRRIQLLTMTVTTVDINDCHSQDYMNICVTERYLPNLKGKWYKINDTDELKCIEGNEKDLLNRVIKLRTAFGCKAPDPSKICTTCLGKLSENFKENSNLGYTMTSSLMEKLTQAILSTKHLTHSVKKSAIKLEGESERYFYSNDNNDIFFNRDLDLEHLCLVLPANQLNKLVDVLSLDHTNVALNKVGELETVGILNTKMKPPVLMSVSVAYKDRLSTITRDLLKHIKASEVESDARGNFIVPLKCFDKTRPVFSNQLKETNIISFVNKIASLIEVTKTTKLSLEEHYLNLVDIVLDQFPCNLSVLETIVYATTSYNAYDGNYRLARETPHARVENKSVLFRNRSASQLLVFEGQYYEMIRNAPIIFSNKYRSNHPLDVLFTPADVIKEEAKQ